MDNKSVYRPAIKSGIGIWNYYVSTMTFEQINDLVKLPDEIYESKKLSDMIQRSLTANTKAICEYISTENERFFNSLVLAVYDGEPKWYEGSFEKNGEEFYNIGVLEFTGLEKIFPVDGQHRVAAIKEVVEKGNKSIYEEIPVIFIAHVNNEEGRKRTRRLFTTLNRYAKPVKQNEIIALDEDDIVAITTRRMVDSSELFADHRITTGKTESISKSDNTSFTNIITLYKCNEYLLKSYFFDKKIKENLTQYKRYRKEDTVIDDFYNYCMLFWQELSENIAEISEYLDDSVVNDKRNEDGGNLLFRPAGLKAYVEAICEIHIATNDSYKTIFFKMKNVNLSLNEAPWRKVLWDDISKKMIMNNKKLVMDFLCYNYNTKWENMKGKKIDISKMVESYASLLNYDMSDGEESIIDLILQTSRLG